jgi:serine/threonine protein kinase
MSAKNNSKQILPESPELFIRSDFEFQRKLGDGAFGQVWKVRHKSSSNFYAIKQVQKMKVMRIIDQFKREVSIMYSLDHPHLVKLFSHFEDDKFFYLILELVEGGNLFQKLSREQVLTERVAAQYFRELVLAVEYLHTRSPVIIHRDIKPENILIDKAGRIKLSDFGWANYVNKTCERLTSCGTLEYLPPEMVDEKGHDTCADIWCLGVLLYEMLTGTTPFKASGKEKTMKNIISQGVKFPLGFSHIAKDLIQKMLEKEKEKRIDIFHVKIHRWLSIMLPLRETMVQNFVPKVLGNEEIEKMDEVKTAYSENDTDEDLKAQENAFRKSVGLMKALLIVQSQGVKSKRNSLNEGSEELRVLNERAKEVESKIEAKKQEIFNLNGKTKEFLSISFDLNLELEKLQNLDPCLLNDQVKELQKRHVELKKLVKLQQIYLENLKSQTKTSTQSYINSEKTLKSSQKQLLDLKNSSLSSRSRHRSSIHELEFNLDLLKGKIIETDKIIEKFSQTDQNVAREISDLIRAKMDTSKSFHRTLSRKLEEIDEVANEKEQQISELRIEYEMKKSQKTHLLRKKKDELMRASRKAKDDFRILYAKKV